MDKIKYINTYKLIIEKLLFKVMPSFIKYTDLDIRGNVYGAIEECFIYIEGNDNSNKIEKFKFNYKHISGQSLDNLYDEKFDIDNLIADLKDLVNCVEE